MPMQDQIASCVKTTRANFRLDKIFSQIFGMSISSQTACIQCIFHWNISWMDQLLFFLFLHIFHILHHNSNSNIWTMCKLYCPVTSDVHRYERQSKLFCLHSHIHLGLLWADNECISYRLAKNDFFYKKNQQSQNPTKSI